MLWVPRQEAKGWCMELINFENADGEGIVAFLPWQTVGSEYEKDHSRWYCHLMVAGERIFEYGCPCGTCGILFRKVGSVAHRLSDTEAVRLLGELDSIPTESNLQDLARILEPGLYHPMIIEGNVRLIQPGTTDDYFTTDVVRLFGLEAPDYKMPPDPQTPYYHFGTDHQLERTGRLDGPHQALVTAIVMPLHDPFQLDRERVEYWKGQYKAGVRLITFAVSVIDDQEPFDQPADQDYKFKEQFLFTNCILDGHHRIQAAAELGAPVRILTLLARNYSIFRNTDDLATVVSSYGALTNVK